MEDWLGILFGCLGDVCEVVVLIVFFVLFEVVYILGVFVVIDGGML